MILEVFASLNDLMVLSKSGNRGSCTDSFIAKGGRREQHVAEMDSAVGAKNALFVNEAFEPFSASIVVRSIKHLQDTTIFILLTAGCAEQVCWAGLDSDCQGNSKSSRHPSEHQLNQK